EHIDAAISGIPAAGGVHAVHHPHQHGGAVGHGAVDHLADAGFLGLQECGEDPHGVQHAAATEVTHQVHGRYRALPGAAAGVEWPGDGDVVDVVAGGHGQGTGLA